MSAQHRVNKLENRFRRIGKKLASLTMRRNQLNQAIDVVTNSSDLGSEEKLARVRALRDDLGDLEAWANRLVSRAQALATGLTQSPGSPISERGRFSTTHQPGAPA
jgi:hypothetical protein